MLLAGSLEWATFPCYLGMNSCNTPHSCQSIALIGNHDSCNRIRPTSKGNSSSGRLLHRRFGQNCTAHEASLAPSHKMLSKSDEESGAGQKLDRDKRRRDLGDIFRVNNTFSFHNQIAQPLEMVSRKEVRRRACAQPDVTMAPNAIIGSQSRVDA